jgi:CubicO group peptidase (beta-lactamase class C family)
VLDQVDVAIDAPHGRIAGTVCGGFEGVARAFEENFTARGEVGAAFAAYHRGQPVVDLWGGLADHATGAPWRRDTVQLIFSGTKGLVGVCLLLLIDRGLLDLDAPVCRYWSEFGRAGKERIRVRDVVSHRAGLPGVRAALSLQDILDEHLMARRLEREAPFPGLEGRVSYHPLTFGWLCAELIRRIDGRSVGRFFAEEVAGPLALELWIGLPPSVEPRVATLVPGADWGTSPEHTLGSVNAAVAAAWDNPPGRLAEPLQQNTRAFHAAGVPATGAIGTARSIARLYGCLACDGELDGVRLVSAQTVARARTCLARGRDALVGVPRAFSVGFELQTELTPFGPPQSAFGHTGAGGSAHGAWPALHAGFSYAMNELRDEDPDPRAQALLRALHDAIACRGG